MCKFKSAGAPCNNNAASIKQCKNDLKFNFGSIQCNTRGHLAVRTYVRICTRVHTLSQSVRQSASNK